VKHYLLSYRSFALFISLACFFLVAGRLTAAPLTPGDAFPTLKGMQDQHEVSYALPKGVKHVAVAFTMSVGKSANKALAEKGASFLPDSKAVFIANIYGMPAVGRFFAMPKMRKYPHRIMLADAEGLLADFPQKENVVTVFDLDTAGKIIDVRYWNPNLEKAPF
jgi:spermidine/putrescine-binding protein